jgi:hypothetical protein
VEGGGEEGAEGRLGVSTGGTAGGRGRRQAIHLVRLEGGEKGRVDGGALNTTPRGGRVEGAMGTA